MGLEGTYKFGPQDVSRDATPAFAGLILDSPLAIDYGGTGQITAQAAIDALSAVLGATNEYVLTKDTASGNAIWKEAAVGDTSGEYYMYMDVNGTPTKVYSKIITGTLDADASTNFAHGVGDIDKIYCVSAVIFDNANSVYHSEDYRGPAPDTLSWQLSFNASIIIIDLVGADSQGQKYRVRIDYVK